MGETLKMGISPGNTATTTRIAGGGSVTVTHSTEEMKDSPRIAGQVLAVNGDHG